MRSLCLVISVAIASQGLATGNAVPGRKCLHLNSYSAGEFWSDGIIKGVTEAVQGHCELKRFDLGARRGNPAAHTSAGGAARALIESWKPDVVIASDDVAIRYVIKPFYKDASLPVVFTGVNLPGPGHGLPYKNTTGMFEVPPNEVVVESVRGLLPSVSKGTCLHRVIPGRTSESNESAFWCDQHIRFAASLGITVKKKGMDTLSELDRALVDAKAGGSQFVMLQSLFHLKGWNPEAAGKTILKHADVITVSEDTALQGVAMITIAEDTEELGAYAGRTALRVLRGTAPRDIPVVNNRLWRTVANEEALRRFKSVKRL